MPEVNNGPGAPTERPATPNQYRTILADPPWKTNQTGRLGAIRHYPLMSLNQICALRVDRLATDDAHLWLWVTNSNFFEGIAVMEAWGFAYRSCLTWIKPRFGLGNYLRNQTEHLLFGIRGRAPIQFRSQGTWFYAPVQEHSHKPEEQYAIVERCSPGPYLELFARRPRPGWDVWGNEVSCDVAL
ncbi:MT-A70 family methyltransferase [Streptomyces broussonetiae]|uniref:MT-A70 family methyltransferase n=1 Tax=Streptomyces broussonetiae TaxID=2686304 RepID=A0ABV5EJX1_9ACTN